MAPRLRSPSIANAFLGAILGAGCSSPCDVDSSYDPPIDPAAFVASIDHPYLPMTPGTVSTYEGGGETGVVTVTSETKSILGVTCTVVHDVVFVDGEMIEETFDWFAQDVYGNVWYFGEDTKELENGRVVGSEGSWTAGVDGAKPGIVMHANPVPAVPYQQEYYACHAEDRAEVLTIGETATVPFGSFDDCIRTHDYTPLEPDVNEQKVFCRGVGLAYELDVETGVRIELVGRTGP